MEVGVADGIKIWGYRILGIIIVLSVCLAIRAFKKNNTKKVIKSLAVVPMYLVALFIVLVGYNLFFIKGSELDKQKSYISDNISFTKNAYDININEKTIDSTGTMTEKEANENEEVINNIPIITENVVINNLLQTQTNTGYYTYSKAKTSLYNNKLSYIAGRELDSQNDTDEYTHGYGAVISSASETDEAGNIKYISRDFENDNIKEPRIYYGTKNSKIKTIKKSQEEFDYPKSANNNVTYRYSGERTEFL